MKSLTKLLLLGVLIINVANLSAKTIDYLKICQNKQVKSLNGEFLTFQYQEKYNKLEHNSDPWKQSKFLGGGSVLCNAENFIRQDSMTSGPRKYFSKSQLSKSELLFSINNKSELAEVTQSMFLDETFESARYSPIIALNYFFSNNIKPEKDTNKNEAVYSAKINKSIVKLYINKADFLINKMTVLSNDDLYGDVLTVMKYLDYDSIKEFYYPKTILIDKLNGKLTDEVKITNSSLTKKFEKILEKPADYTMKDEKEIKSEIKTEQINDNIYLVNLSAPDIQCLIVEFSDFLLAATAPLNSENGELIIKEARKISDSKPIKYFIFGHHHPHYLGGIRAFIRQGASILCRKSNEDYVKYIADAQRTMQPDSLQIHPAKLQIEEVGDSMTISDGSYSMKIYYIGAKSDHTNDFLIYYFPKEKIVYEDDLVWIPKEGEIKKASPRQKGLYNAIKDLNLDVTTIIQSWPVSAHKVKTIIPFQDLETSVNIK